MRTLTQFLPFVMPYVNGCTESMAEQEILTACIEFASRSCIVQNTQIEAAVSGQAEYDVEVPSQMNLVRVLAVYYRTQRLAAVSREMVTYSVAARGEAVDGVDAPIGTPREWVARDPSQALIGLYPAPDEDVVGAITIVSAHAPARSATRVADTLFDDYAADIGAGAVARLLSMPNQPFSSPMAAKGFRDQFNAAVGAANIIARVGYGAATSFVRPRRFA